MNACHFGGSLHHAAIAALFLSALAATAQDATLTPNTNAPAIIEVGPNHRVWKSNVPGAGTVTELADCLNYFDGVSWKAAEEKIEALADGSAAVAQKGQFRTRFAGNLNTAGGIELTFGNAVFQSHVSALVYFDWALGQSVLLATPKDSIGQLPIGSPAEIIVLTTSS